jgi:hypothetical protein
MARKNTNPLTSEKVTYFASGSNHAGEIEGWASIGAPVGVAAPDLNAAAVEALKATAGKVPVFVDSGAFSEVEFGANGPQVVKPMTADDWNARLALYLELAQVLGAALTVVAPDKVGFAGETLGRLSKYRKQVKAIAATGARVLVPLQGADKVTFWKRAQLALDMTEADGLVPALPCKKNATSPAEVVAFVKAAKPRAIHCLGLGARNTNAAALVRELRAVDADVEISLDSNAIRANVGRRGRLAPLTAATDEVVAEAQAAGRSLTVRAKKAAAIRRAFCYGEPVQQAQLTLGLGG